MKRLFIPVFGLLFLFGCGGSEGEDKGGAGNGESTDTSNTTIVTPPEGDGETPEGQGGRDGVLIHITAGTDDAFQFCRALKMAEEQAATNDVLVYFDQRAVDAIWKDSKPLAYNPFPASDGQISKLKELGVKLRFCADCTGAFFRKPSDVMPDITPLGEGELTGFTAGRIVSLDY